MFLLLVAAQAQFESKDTTEYRSETLKLEEANLVSGYYKQDGNHSAVTGGIGTQHLTDISNVIELKFVKWNNATNNKYSLDIEAGIDHHTSASQAYVSKTGASRPYGTRIYPSVNWSVEKPNKLTLGAGLSFSNEYNYHSFGGNVLLGKTSKDDNTSINFKGQVFLDKVTMLEPSELIPGNTNDNVTTYTTASGRVISSGGHGNNIPKTSRNTYDASLTLTHVVNKNMQVALLTDVVAQNGFLGLPFHRVYFNYPLKDSARIENLPSTRVKLPVGLRLNYFLGDKVILRTYYRYYSDSWGIKSHTASLEIPYKFSPYVSAAPFYRFYTQTAADYFAPYKAHLTSDKYYTSNYDLAAFSANFVGFNFRFTPPKGVYLFDMIELRYGHYVQTTGLHGDNVGINIRFK